jgi:hypothetical protein
LAADHRNLLDCRHHGQLSHPVLSEETVTRDDHISRDEMLARQKPHMSRVTGAFPNRHGAVTRQVNLAKLLKAQQLQAEMRKAKEPC